MTITNNKHIAINEIVRIKQLHFPRVTFFSWSEVSVVFDTSYLHANTNSPIRRFSHEQFLVSKYSSILHALLHSQSHVLGFQI